MHGTLHISSSCAQCRSRQFSSIFLLVLLADAYVRMPPVCARHQVAHCLHCSLDPRLTPPWRATRAVGVPRVAVETCDATPTVEVMLDLDALNAAIDHIVGLPTAEPGAEPTAPPSFAELLVDIDAHIAGAEAAPQVATSVPTAGPSAPSWGVALESAIGDIGMVPLEMASAPAAGSSKSSLYSMCPTTPPMGKRPRVDAWPTRTVLGTTTKAGVPLVPKTLAPAPPAGVVAGPGLAPCEVLPPTAQTLLSLAVVPPSAASASTSPQFTVGENSGWAPDRRYWRANAQRYGSRGSRENPNVQWHTPLPLRINPGASRALISMRPLAHPLFCMEGVARVGGWAGTQVEWVAVLGGGGGGGVAGGVRSRVGMFS